MRRFFLQNIFFVLLVNILIKPVWIFFIDRSVQNTLGASVYGGYMALFNLAIIFQILMDFGLTSYHTKVVSQDRSQLPQLFPSFFWARLILTCAYTLVVLSVGYTLGYDANEMTLLGGVMVIQALNSFVLFLRSGIAALHRFKADAAFSVMDKVLMILICSGLLLIPSLASQFKLQWFVAAQQISYAITAIAAFILLTNYAGVRLRFNFNKTLVLQVLRASIPYAVLILLMAIYIRADLMMLESLLPDGKREAGLYYAGFRLLDAVNILGLSLAGVLLPLFGRMLAERQPIKPILHVASNFILPVAITVALICWWYAQPIMESLMHDTTTYSGTILRLLMCAFPAYSLMYIFSTLLTADGRLKQLILFSAIAVAINLLINFWLIPSQGAVGAAFAATITQWFMAIACLITCARLWKLKVYSRVTFRPVVFAIVNAVAAYGIAKLPLFWMWGAGIMVAVGLLSFLLLGFFSLREWAQLLQLKSKTSEASVH